MSEGQAPAAPQAAPESNSQPVNDISAEDLASISGENSEGGEGQAQGGTPQAAAQAKADVQKAQKEVDSAKTAKDKAEAQKKLDNAKRKFQLKVDGEEVTWEGTDEDIKRELQLSKKARKEIQESSELKKEIMNLLSALKKDPAKVLADPAIGVDVKEFARSILAKQLEDEMKSPEQLEKEKLQAELEMLREEMKTKDETRKQQEYDHYVRQIEQDIEEKTQEALETSGLPKTPYILKRMTDVMISAINANKEISPKQALSIVKREMQKDMQDMFSVAPEDLIEQLIGSDTLKRVNKKQLERIKKVNSARVADTGYSATRV